LWPGSAGNAVDLVGLQWTKPRRGATLQCNVDRLDGGGLTIEITEAIDQTPPHQSE
jgi:hypothetical protein